LKFFAHRVRSLISEKSFDARTLLWAGILVRVVTCLALAPENPDNHSEILDFIVAHKALPHALDLHESYAPPLYYILAAPLLALSGYLKVVQILSLVLAIGNLLVFYDLIYRQRIIENSTAQFFSFLLACFLPEFVTCSLFVSNDCLTFFLSTLSILLVYRFARDPTRKRLVVVALALGLGLLTKQSFLAFVPIWSALVFTFSLQNGVLGALRRTTIFLIIVVSVGSYKFIENYRYYHDPFVNNMDARPTPAWVVEQRRSYRGWRSFADFDLTKLVASPSVSDLTNGSYPVLLYGTFWYQHNPISNFAWLTPVNRLAQLIYLIATIPTLAFLIGAVGLIRRAPELMINVQHAANLAPKVAIRYASAAALVLNLGMLVVTVLKYHVWSIMDARLLYPSLFGGLVIFSSGVEIVSRWRIPQAILRAGMFGLTALFVTYPLLEFVLTVRWRLLNLPK
jgi:4-amino-4-deoxy-L-arabinose transferase-like glycosyltransferase